MNIHEQAYAIVTENPALRKQVGTLSSLLSRRVISADNEIQFDADDLDGSLGRLLDAAGDASAAALAALATASDLTASGTLTTLGTNIGAHDAQGITLLSALLATTGAGTAVAATTDLVTTSTPTTGGTVTAGATKANQLVNLTPAGTLAALTFTFPTNANSRIGQRLTLLSSQIVTTLTVSSSTLTLNGIAATSLEVNVPITWVKTAASTWSRIDTLGAATALTLVSAILKTGLTASGSAANDFSGSTGTFKTSTGANTLGGVVELKTIATAVAAAGSSGSDAAALGAANLVTITSDSAAKGVKLLTGVAGQRIELINRSSTAAVLYPATGGTINGLTANAGVVIPASKGVVARCTAADTWFVDDTPARATAA